MAFKNCIKGLREKYPSQTQRMCKHYSDNNQQQYTDLINFTEM